MCPIAFTLSDSSSRRLQALTFIINYEKTEGPCFRNPPEPQKVLECSGLGKTIQDAYYFPEPKTERLIDG
jgi:hypothetical protein